MRPIIALSYEQVREIVRSSMRCGVAIEETEVVFMWCWSGIGDYGRKLADELRVKVYVCRKRVWTGLGLMPIPPKGGGADANGNLWEVVNPAPKPQPSK